MSRTVEPSGFLLQLLLQLNVAEDREMHIRAIWCQPVSIHRNEVLPLLICVRGKFSRSRTNGAASHSTLSVPGRHLRRGSSVKRSMYLPRGGVWSWLRVWLRCAGRSKARLIEAYQESRLHVPHRERNKGSRSR